MAERTATHHHYDIASSSTAPRSASTPDDYFNIFVNHSADETGDFARKLSVRLVGRGLYVFLDGIDKEVTPRVEAASSLASLQIAIFSENYVSCKWCMDTLVQMTKSEAPILPVFYQVEPSHLRYTGQDGKGPYAQWLRAHEGSYDSQTMQAWRNALENVSKRKGFELKKRNGGEEEHLCRDKEELLCKIVKSVESVESVMKARFYHVFICHCGETEEEFAEPLYGRLRGLLGLRVFLDKEELVAGRPIEPQIETAIQLASVNIVIFSPKFSESSWCLDKLTLMQTSGAKILPVFYGVKPPDLDVFYNETLLSHQKKERYNTETINRWRNALANVPNSDLMLAGNEENKEALMSKIVERVLEYIPEPSELSRQSYELQRAVESILDEDVSKQSKVQEQRGEQKGAHE